jgi:hypothetical protein
LSARQFARHYAPATRIEQFSFHQETATLDLIFNSQKAAAAAPEKNTLGFCALPPPLCQMMMWNMHWLLFLERKMKPPGTLRLG